MNQLQTVDDIRVYMTDTLNVGRNETTRLLTALETTENSSKAINQIKHILKQIGFLSGFDAHHGKNWLTSANEKLGAKPLDLLCTPKGREVIHDILTFN